MLAKISGVLSRRVTLRAKIAGVLARCVTLRAKIAGRVAGLLACWRSFSAWWRSFSACWRTCHPAGKVYQHGGEACPQGGELYQQGGEDCQQGYEALGRRRLLCGQSFVPVEAVPELVEGTENAIMLVVSTDSTTGDKVNAVALLARKPRLRISHNSCYKVCMPGDEMFRAVII
jgi:hypothetical protein